MKATVESCGHPCPEVSCGDLLRYVADVPEDSGWFTRHCRACRPCSRVTDLLAWLRSLQGRPVFPWHYVQSQCLLPATLKQYDEGRLNKESEKSVRNHLHVCQSCQRLLDLIRYDRIHADVVAWSDDENLLQHPTEGYVDWGTYSCVSAGRMQAYLSHQVKDHEEQRRIREHCNTNYCKSCAGTLELLTWLRFLRKQPISIGECRDKDSDCIPNAVLIGYTSRWTSGDVGDFFGKYRYIAKHLKGCKDCARCLELIRYQKDHSSELIWPAWEKPFCNEVGSNYPNQQKAVVKWACDLLEGAATSTMGAKGASAWLKNRLAQTDKTDKAFGGLTLQQLLNLGREDVLWSIIKSLELGSTS